MIFNAVNASKLIQLEKELGKVELMNPSYDDLTVLMVMYDEAGSDTRRLEMLSDEAYVTRSEETIRKDWNTALEQAKAWVANGKLFQEAYDGIQTQSEAILAYQSIPPKDTAIPDPFNMEIVEDKDGIEELKRAQLKNILVAKVNGEIASTGRILEVDGGWEIVSIVTKEKYRGEGLASFVIQNLLSRFSLRPVYSFQRLHLVSYYLRKYKNWNPQVAVFSELPFALQRDLFRMNIFWGPFVIIKINT